MANLGDIFVAPMVTASVAYWAVELQFMQPVIAMMPWPTPVGAGAFISTGGDYMSIVISILCAIIAFLIWFPFIKMYDQKLLAQEAGEDALI